MVCSTDLNERADLKVQLGFRHTGGLSQIDNLVGTGLGEINDRSSRWSMPLSFGVHFRF